MYGIVVDGMFEIIRNLKNFQGLYFMIHDKYHHTELSFFLQNTTSNSCTSKRMKKYQRYIVPTISYNFFIDIIQPHLHIMW